MPSKTSKPKATSAPKADKGAPQSEAPKGKSGAKPVAREKIDAFGLENLCSAIADGNSLTAIAQSLDVSIGSLLTWVESDPERSARAREARALTARLWDNKATETLEAAQEPFDLAKAKELAHHYRWRASKIAPREYGEKLALEHSGDVTLNDAQLDARIDSLGASLLAAIGQAAVSGPDDADRGEAEEG